MKEYMRIGSMEEVDGIFKELVEGQADMASVVKEIINVAIEARSSPEKVQQSEVSLGFLYGFWVDF